MKQTTIRRTFRCAMCGRRFRNMADEGWNHPPHTDRELAPHRRALEAVARPLTLTILLRMCSEAARR